MLILQAFPDGTVCAKVFAVLHENCKGVLLRAGTLKG
jgi:hypothetical protein